LRGHDRLAFTILLAVKTGAEAGEVSAAEPARDLSAARDAEPDLLQELCRVRVLVLDDLAVGELTPWREETLLALLGRVDRGRRTLVTSNVEPAAMAPFIGERCADRLGDPEMFRVVAVGGESLRGAKGGAA